MKSKRTFAVILAVLPLVLFAAGLIMNVVCAAGYKVDPMYWHEHGLGLIAVITVIVAAVLSIPCGIIARTLNRQKVSEFVNIVTIIDFAIPAVVFLLFVLCLL